MNFLDLENELFKSLEISEGGREDFLSPDYSKLHDPLLLPNMERARDRVISAVKNGEHIVVFSDYDADGIPGAVVMSDFFRRIGYENVSFYIPHRHDEGFGLNTAAMEECSTRSAKLIITVDCGIAGVKEVALANERGMDVIITDHHLPALAEAREQAGELGEVLPEAYAIVDPKLEESTYPFKELCGAGVAYKLVQAILAKELFGTKPGMEKWSLDMVGIATLSDMVPLVGENRILAWYGLEVLRKSPRPGLAALFKKLNINQKYVSEDDIAFMITPRINAASRMDSPEDAFKLLSTADPEEAEKLALHLEKINNERKGLVASVVKDAKKHLAMRELVREVIVVGNPEWRPAVLGLVANTLVEEYERPVFVWGRDGEGILKGSCRSYNGHDLHALMSGTPESFIEFGGHTGAGGFSVTLENLSVLEEKLSECFKKAEEKKEEVVAYDAPLIPIELKDIGEGLWKTLSLFAPFGMSNPKPVFEIKGEIKNAKQFGKEANHLEIEMTNPSTGSGQVVRSVKAISFFSSPSAYKVSLTPGAPVTVHAHLEKSYFRNRPELRLRIVDIK